MEPYSNDLGRRIIGHMRAKIIYRAKFQSCVVFIQPRVETWYAVSVRRALRYTTTHWGKESYARGGKPRVCTSDGQSQRQYNTGLAMPGSGAET